jgi:hypothetical protein
MPELPSYRRTMIAQDISNAWSAVAAELTSSLNRALQDYHQGQEEIAALKSEVATLKAADSE